MTSNNYWRSTLTRWTRRPLTVAALVLSSVFLTSCGGGDDSGGGIIGTGIQLRGTVPTNRAFAESTIEIKARTGERSTATIASNGQFSADDVQGEGPFLLRVNLGNGIFYYGISHAVDAASATQNVHAYSDIVIRNWFARNGLDIDSTFDSTGPIAALPSQTDTATIEADVTALIAPALNAYGLANINLQTAAFTADNLGVDRFLDLNPVIVNNGTITIVITDPDNSTATTVANELAISTDLSAVDSIPPFQPVGVRALPSALNEIVVAWEPSGDNIAVVSYEVVRDGAVVAETPFPVYIDSGLQSGIVFEYAVVALDAAGNRSSLSSIAGSSTLAAPDITAPPSPTDVQLTASTASVDVRWTQSDIADVASFTLLRSEAGGMLDTLVRVTATAFNDVGLNSGTEYCYQVIASDASQNDSDASDVVCVVTTGSTVTGTPPVTTPITPPIDPPVNGGAADHLLAVDVSGVSCTNELTNSDVSGTVTIPAGCYNVPNGLSLGDGDFLTLSPGAILKFGSADSLTVGEDASLTAVGTDANPIVLTGLQATPGFWTGVVYNFSNNLNNQLENVVIEYAGSGSNPSTSAALNVNANSSFVSRLSANLLLLRDSTSDGFRFDNGSILDRFDNVIAINNNRVGAITPELAGSIGSTAQFTGNTIDAISLTNDDIDQASTMPNFGVPWLVDRLDVDAPLEIAAGNTFMFDASGGLFVSESGSLRAIGTAAAPITFTGSQMTPGFWNGVEFVFSPSINNVLDHTVIEYAGSGSSTTAGALTTSANGSFPSRIAINNTILRNSRGSGFYLAAGTIIDQFDNVSSTGNDQSGSMEPEVVSELGSGLNLQGNTVDVVGLFDGDVEIAQTWPSLNVPYRFDRVTVEAALSLSAGVTMVGVSGAFINVQEEGSLTAVGTPAAPISFIGEQATAGFWDGLDYSFSNNTQNVLEHVVISDAGGGGAPTSSGSIEISCTSSFPSRLSMSDTTVSNGISFGVFTSTNGCIVNVGANVDVSGNALGGFNIAP